MKCIIILPALLLCWFSFCIPSYISAQSNDSTAALAAFEQANESYYYGDFAKALDEARTANTLMKELNTSFFTKQIEANLLLAKCYVFAEKNDSAFYFLDEAESRLLEHESLDTTLLASVYGFRSHAHDRNSELKLAMDFGKKSLKWARSMNPPHPKLGDFYHGLANVYFSLGDYKFSYDLYQQAVDFYVLTKDINDPSVLETRMAKSYVQVLYGDIDGALVEMNHLIEECAQKEESKTTLMALYAIKASALSKQEKNTEALVNVDKSLDLILEMFGENNGFAADVMQAKAKLLFDLDQHDESEAMYQRVIDICESSPNSFSDILAAARTEYGDLLAQTDRFDEAVMQFDKSLEALHYQSVEQVHEVSYFKELLDVMKMKSNAFLKEHKRNGNMDLVKASVFDEAIDLVELVRSIYVHEGSKQKLIEGNYSLFENALKAKYAILGDSANDKTVEQFFEVIEKSKVQTLLDQLRYTEGIASDKIPEKEALAIDSIKQIMMASRQELFLARDQSDSIFNIRNHDYIQHKESFESYVSKLRATYPEYYQFVYVQDVIPLNKLRESILNKRTTLVEYFLGESHLYSMYISKRDVKYSMIPLPENFRELISSGLDEMIRGESTEAINKIIHDVILTDLYKNVPQKTNRLIIVPDGELMYIPFEMLPGKASEYLIEQYKISYASSATLLAYQENMSPRAERSFAGFAPSYNKDVAITIDTSMDSEVAALVRSGTMELASTVGEVESIADLMNGDLFIEQAATETEFKTLAAKYDILHLAMHALVNTSNPSYSRLLFDLSSTDGENDGQLHVEELYGMDLNARLAVLSACNTGFGNIKKGEGSLSIARAFTYAGVPSTLMSLWEVPDKSTAAIMIDFYEQLAKGKTKDAALRQAKLNYIANPSFSAELKKPLYWAGFIATGDMSALPINTNLWIYWIGFGLLLGIVLIWWLRRK